MSSKTKLAESLTFCIIEEVMEFHHHVSIFTWQDMG